MTSNKCFLTCALALLVCSSWLRPSMAQAPCSGIGCRHYGAHQKGLEVGCAPRRETYGYFETQWRRWPTESPEFAPTPATGQGPTTPDEAPPAEQGGPARIEPDQPRIEPDQPRIDTTPLPSETPETGVPSPTPTVPLPGAEPDMTLPFEDVPPTPPADSPGLPTLPTETPSPVLPALQPQIQPAPLDDAAPKMPEDDPFKDDPPEPTPESTPEPAPAPPPEPATPAAVSGDQQTRRISPAPERATQVAGQRWRAVGTSALLAAVPPDTGAGARQDITTSQPDIVSAGTNESMDEAPRLTRVPAGSEPNLVPPAADAFALRREPEDVLPPVAIAEQNPLRLVSATMRDERVVRASGTTSSQANAGPPIPSPRRNPLRGN